MQENTFGQFLSKKRKEKNLTQKELANMLFVSESAVSKWEKDVARPDLSLITKLSNVLGVTEHELINASIDEKNREKEKDAKKWKNLSKTFDMFFYISYGIAILTCFIVNLAVDKTLEWFFIVLCSVLLSASFTTFPKYIKKLRIIFIPLSELLCLLLLLLVCNIYTGGNWFLISAIPTVFGVVVVFLPIIFCKLNVPKFIKNNNAIISVTVDFILLCFFLIYINVYIKGNYFIKLMLPFLSMGYGISLINVFILRYVKVNKLLKSGLNLLAWTIIYLLVGYSVIPILKDADIKIDNNQNFNPFLFDFSSWKGDNISNNVLFIIFITLTFLSLIFIILGVKKRKKKI